VLLRYSQQHSLLSTLANTQNLGVQQAQLPHALELRTASAAIVVAVAAPATRTYTEWCSKLRSCCPGARFESLAASGQGCLAEAEGASASDNRRTRSERDSAKHVEDGRKVESAAAAAAAAAYRKKSSIRDAYMTTHKEHGGLRQPPLRCLMRAPLAADLAAAHCSLDDVATLPIAAVIVTVSYSIADIKLAPRVTASYSIADINR